MKVSGIKVGKRTVVLLSLIALYFYLLGGKKPADYIHVNGSMDSIYHYTQQLIAGTEDISFYTPYRDRSAEYKLAVVCEDSMHFNLEGRILIPKRNEDLIRFKNRMICKGFINTLRYYVYVVSKIRELERKGIYGVYRKDSLTRISTTFFDSSYQQLAARYPESLSGFENAKLWNDDPQPITISFVVIKRPLSDRFFQLLYRNNNLIEIKPNVYYYRSLLGLKKYRF